MNDVVIKRRQWRELRSGQPGFEQYFKHIVIKTNKRYEIALLMAEAEISYKNVFEVQSVKYEFPERLDNDDIQHRKFSVDINETTFIYFYDEIDWAKIQILR